MQCKINNRKIIVKTSNNYELKKKINKNRKKNYLRKKKFGLSYPLQQ